MGLWNYYVKASPSAMTRNNDNETKQCITHVPQDGNNSHVMNRAELTLVARFHVVQYGCPQVASLQNGTKRNVMPDPNGEKVEQLVSIVKVFGFIICWMSSL